MNNIETHEDAKEPIKACQWKINGHDLMEEKSGAYFRTVIPYQKYIRIPDNFVYVHSFSINLFHDIMDFMNSNLYEDTNNHENMKMLTLNYNIENHYFLNLIKAVAT